MVGSLANGSRNCEPVHLGHPVIENDDINEVLGEQTQSCMTAVGREHRISLHLQQQFPNVE